MARFRDKRTGRFVSAETAHRSNAQRRAHGRPAFYVDVKRSEAAKRGAETRARKRAAEERAERRRERELRRRAEELEMEEQEIEVAVDYEGET